jgi:hypothetical protein
VIAALNVFATNSILRFVPPEQVDQINPVAQVFRTGLSGAGVLAAVLPISVLLLLSRDVAQTACIFTGSTRLPTVAGWIICCRSGSRGSTRGGELR